MIRTLIAALIATCAFAAHGAVDVNKASQAELETIKGIGPSVSTRILDERKKGEFKDWSDMVVRVKGVGPGNAKRFASDGLTVNGADYNGEAVASNKAAGNAASKTSTKDIKDTKEAKAPATAK
jgi:competence protein ComEA